MSTNHGSNSGSLDVNGNNPVVLGDNGSRLYGLEISVEPTEYVQQGTFIHIAVRLYMTGDDTTNHNLFFMVNLVTTEGEGNSGRGLLEGTRAASVPYDDTESQGQGQDVAEFTRLSIRAPGRYRLRIALMQMMTGEGATTMDTVLTRWFEVGNEGR